MLATGENLEKVEDLDQVILIRIEKQEEEKKKKAKTIWGARRNSSMMRKERGHKRTWRMILIWCF